MEAGEYGLARGTCFRRAPSRVGRGRRAAVAFVCVLGGADLFMFFFFRFFFLFSNAHGLLQA